jgi:hypothetical protein
MKNSCTHKRVPGTPVDYLRLIEFVPKRKASIGSQRRRSVRKVVDRCAKLSIGSQRRRSVRKVVDRCAKLSTGLGRRRSVRKVVDQRGKPSIALILVLRE